MVYGIKITRSKSSEISHLDILTDVSHVTALKNSFLFYLPISNQDLTYQIPHPLTPCLYFTHMY
jgi:hypothetical protein